MSVGKFAIITTLALAALLMLGTTPAKSQSNINIFSGSIGGPNTQIKIINNTSDNSPLIPSIANVTGRILRQGQEFQTNIGPFSNMGQIPIEIKMCKETQSMHHFNSAPEWPEGIPQPNGLAITDEYLRSAPDKKELKWRVNEIKKFMHGQPGGNQYNSQMESWLNWVDRYGINAPVDSCISPFVIPLITFNYSLWNAYGGNTVTTVTVVGDRIHGYSIQNPPRWVQ